MAEKPEIQKLASRQIRASEAEVEALANEVGRITNRVITTAARAVDPNDVRESIKVLNDMYSAIEAGGFPQIAERLEKLYGAELARVQELLSTTTGKRVSFGGADVELIETLIQYDFDAITNNVRATVGSARQIITRQIVTGQRPDLNALEDLVDSRTLRNVKTELNTAVSGFNQTMQHKKTEDLGPGRYLYAGPGPDKVIRPFCSEHLGGEYTREQIAGMDNGQGLDVFIYNGGYNCRHQWLFIPDD